MKFASITAALMTLLATHRCLAEIPAPTPVSGKIAWLFDYEQAKRIGRADIAAVMGCLPVRTLTGLL